MELRSVAAIVASNFSVTKAAATLFATQPGLSRHVADVEKALGVEIFVRNKNRFVALSPAGQALVPLIEQLLARVSDLHTVAARYVSGECGRLCIATSQTHARYLLPSVIERFIAEFPLVELQLHQGNQSQISEWIASGEADISLSVPLADISADVELRKFGTLDRVLVAPVDHPILQKTPVSISDIAALPLITYDKHFFAHDQIMNTFDAQMLKPRIALTTQDTDIMKTYVKCGLGIAIVVRPAFSEDADEGLAAIDVSHLFPPVEMYLGLRKDVLLSPHARRFVELVAPAVLD
ncbi:LysR substrate-binding domain-containing protein [Hydrogenophaga sp. BPS33]|uniref:LysR substrate-binding domain-containing protein n=1 Tax=Hydrogenophaga sp. BPS33 TaxID=2651974 RepID=UPI001F41AE98|nr:LysR substrate-binding domain-containing protein [Hydrogenophaga sp. BPS33]